MRRPLRRFAPVSAVVTGIDAAVLAGLGRAGTPVATADATSVALASMASWLLHRRVTLSGDPHVRWARQPGAVALTASIAGSIDVAVVDALTRRRVGLVPAKVAALAVAGVIRVLAYRAVLLTETRRDQSRQRPGPPPPGELRLSVVVPAYGEAHRISSTVARLTATLAGVDADGGVEILVVDDGSTDDTAALAEAAGARVVRLASNSGKGAAVRTGMLAARGRTVAFLDADLAYAPDQLLVLLQRIEAGWDVVVGNRRLPESVDHMTSLSREVSGRLFNRLTVFVLLGRYRDTQCGCKAFRSDVAQSLFSRSHIDGFAFDVEVFHLVERDRLSLTEVPVTLLAAEGSTVRLGVDALGMVRDLFRVRRFAAEGAYAPPTATKVSVEQSAIT